MRQEILQADLGRKVEALDRAEDVNAIRQVRSSTVPTSRRVVHGSTLYNVKGLNTGLRPAAVHADTGGARRRRTGGSEGCAH